jgi:very-short-patch-repair endonuclease
MRSGLQAHIFSLLKELFPNARIRCEHLIKYKGQNLYLDFFIPFLNVAIEVDGRQHDEYNDFFYNSFLQYYEAYRRDRLKEEWAEKNNVALIRIKEHEVCKVTKEQLWERIVDARKEY